MTIQQYLTETDKLFEKEFPIFKVRNYTGDTIIGRTDENGNVMPSDEIIRQQFNEKLKSFLHQRQVGLVELVKEQILSEKRMRSDGEEYILVRNLKNLEK